MRSRAIERGRSRSGARRRQEPPLHHGGAADAAEVLPPPAPPPRLPPEDGAALRIRCFGSFEVWRRGVLVRGWTREKARTLLKILVDRRGAVPRESLIDLLWPDAPVRSAQNSLRVALHALRQALGPAGDGAGPDAELVLFDGSALSLNAAVPLWVDVDAFDAHFDRALKGEQLGRAAAALRDYARAAALYRGDYLAEDPYEDWSIGRRELARDKYLLALTKLAEADLRQRDAIGCIVRCHEILRHDPGREDAYRRLMRSYALLGQPSQAHRWFQRCAQALRAELGVGPSDQTVRLSRAILAGRRIRPTDADGEG